MKRQIQKVGVRKWFGDDWLNLQNELYTALESLYSQYNSFVLSGCEVDGSNNIAAGIVWLDGKIARFEGQATASFPCYLSLQETEIENEIYENGSSLPTRKYYQAVYNTSIPTGDYLTLNATNNPHFNDAIQSASYRFVTDNEKALWNGGNGSGLNADLLDGKHANEFVTNTLSGGGDSDYYTGDLNSISNTCVLGISPSATNKPSSDRGVLITTTIKTVSYIYQNFIASTEQYTRYFNGSTWTSWIKGWSASNDGSGSGLDADTLDGVHLSNLITNSPTVGDQSVVFLGDVNTINVSCIITVGFSASNIPVVSGGVLFTNYVKYGGSIFQMYQTPSSVYLRYYYNSWTTWVELWGASNDGAGSGLNADLLDGYHETSFLRPQSWQTLSLSNSFQGSLKYRKLNSEYVHLTGYIYNVTYPAVDLFIGNMPAGFRIGTSFYYLLPAVRTGFEDLHGKLKVYTSGNLYIRESNDDVSQYNIQYYIDIIYATT